MLCFLQSALLFVIAVGELMAGGVVVWKEQPFHADSSARALAFDRMRVAAPVTWFYSGKSRKCFERHQIFSYIQFPELPPEEVLRRQGLDSLKNQYATLSAFAQRYPNAGALMKTRLDHMRAVAEEFDTGTIHADGKWIPIAEYEQQVYRKKKAGLQREEEAAERLRSEVRRAAGLKMNWMLGVAGAGLVLMLLALLLRQSKLALAVLLVLALGAGWLSHKEGGLGWAREMQEKLTELMEDPRIPWP